MKSTQETPARNATPTSTTSMSRQITEARMFRVALHITNSKFSIERRATIVRLARGVLSEPTYKILKKMVWGITNDQLRTKEQRT